MPERRRKFRQEVSRVSDALLLAVGAVEGEMESRNIKGVKKKSRMFLERAESALNTLCEREDDFLWRRVPLNGATFMKRFAILRENLYRFAYFLWNEDLGNLAELIELEVKPSLREWIDAGKQLQNEKTTSEERIQPGQAPGFVPLKVPRDSDAAGSGDWCTAGVLHKLARGGLAGFRRVNPGRLREALRYGQALAAWNCSYESARGGMYEASRPQFDRQIRALLSGKTFRIAIDKADPLAENLAKLCPNCDEFQPKKRTHAS